MGDHGEPDWERLARLVETAREELVVFKTLLKDARARQLRNAWEMAGILYLANEAPRCGCATCTYVRGRFARQPSPPAEAS